MQTFTQGMQTFVQGMGTDKYEGLNYLIIYRVKSLIINHSKNSFSYLYSNVYTVMHRYIVLRFHKTCRHLCKACGEVSMKVLNNKFRV